MKIRLKRLLNKYKNRIVSFIVVFAFVPLFSISSFAAEIVGLSNGNVIRYTTGSPICILVNSSGSAVYNGAGTFYEYAIGSTPLSNYSFDSPSVNASAIWFGHETFNNNVVVNTELFDYYFIFVVTANNSNLTFVPSSFRVQSYANGTPIVSLTDFSYTSYSDGNAKGFCCIGKMPDVNFSQFAYFNVNGSGVLSEDIYISPFVYVTEKGTETSVDSIISAINNQTSELGGKIDDTNDFIDKGNSSTSSIVSGNNSAIGQLDEVVSEYHATEQQFFDDFNTNQQAITSDIVGWSWGGLVNCANWVGSTMTDYYNNMGDFRQYIIYPLMLGIVLFFLGRGGSIIGHLFRKPTETTVNTKSVFRSEGNTRYTTTTTSRQGGVLRK